MIELKDLSKSFHTADGSVEALKNVNISIPDGSIYGIIGMSGAGKSTLVRCINLLERPSSGQVLIDGVDMSTLKGRQLREKRREIAMIFQGFHLLMQRNVLKNVCFPMELAGRHGAEMKERAMELLRLVGLEEKAGAYPAQLSGGQQQRVAIARALALDPKVLLCDEATSALDPLTTVSILELIRSIQQKLGLTVIVITHQMSVVESICESVAILDGGTVAEAGPVGEIFARPKSMAARRLVYPEYAEMAGIAAAAGKHYIRVVFAGGESAVKPLIARMALDTGITANIAYAATKSVQQKAYGSMLLDVDDPKKRREAIEYLNREAEVSAQEVESDAE